MKLLATKHGLQVQFVFSREQQDMTVQLRSVTDMIVFYSSLPAPGSRQGAYKCDPILGNFLLRHTDCKSNLRSRVSSKI